MMFTVQMGQYGPAVPVGTQQLESLLLPSVVVAVAMLDMLHETSR